MSTGAKGLDAPLADIEVLDLGTLTPGKYCSLLLADLGARVIRIERPDASGQPASDEDLVLNRGKRSMVLDLRSVAGLDALRRLAARADVVLEGNRPGVADRRGFGHAALARLNPRLVYCSLSAFGHTGPYRDDAAYDLMFMGMSGVWHAMLAGRAPPPAPGIFLADAVTGLVSAFAIVTALYQRGRSGTGRHLDLAMLDSTFGLLGVSHGLRRDAPQGEPCGEPQGAPPGERIGPARPPGASPAYRLYRARDGEYVVMGALRPAAWHALCDLIERPELSRGPSLGEAQSAAVVRAVTEKLATDDAASWIQRLRALGIDCALHQPPEAAFEDPQLRARGMLAQLDHPQAGRITTVASPLAPVFGAAATRPAPAIGQDSAAIVEEIG